MAISCLLCLGSILVAACFASLNQPNCDLRALTVTLHNFALNLSHLPFNMHADFEANPLNVRGCHWQVPFAAVQTSETNYGSCGSRTNLRIRRRLSILRESVDCCVNAFSPPADLPLS